MSVFNILFNTSKHLYISWDPTGLVRTWRLGLGIENRFQNRILKVRNPYCQIKISIPPIDSYAGFFFFICEDKCDLVICQDLAH